jgi:hypothetical protein
MLKNESPSRGEFIMLETIALQLALDYCCSVADVKDHVNHFSENKPLDGRRLFHDGNEECFLKIAVINGKLLVTGRKDVVAKIEGELQNVEGAWFMEMKSLSRLNEMILDYGYQIEQAHPFYTAHQKTSVNTDGYDIVWYDQTEIEQFRGDDRFQEAFVFCAAAPDKLGVAAIKNGTIMGMAGASSDSPYLWQIGINTLPGYEAKGIGTLLVTLMKNAVLDRNIIPYYGTAMSHVASQRVAIKSGFLPAWAELITSRK